MKRAKGKASCEVSTALGETQFCQNCGHISAELKLDCFATANAATDQQQPLQCAELSPIEAFF